MQSLFYTCPRCGTSAPPACYCSQCGFEFRAPALAPVKRRNQKYGLGWIALWVSLLLLPMCFFGGLFYLLVSPTPADPPLPPLPPGTCAWCRGSGHTFRVVDEATGQELLPLAILDPNRKTKIVGTMVCPFCEGTGKNSQYSPASAPSQ